MQSFTEHRTVRRVVSVFPLGKEGFLDRRNSVCTAFGAVVLEPEYA